MAAYHLSQNFLLQKQTQLCIITSHNNPILQTNQPLNFATHTKLSTIRNSHQRVVSTVGSSHTQFGDIILFCAQKGFVNEAHMLWNESLDTKFTPDYNLVASLILAYEKAGDFDRIFELLSRVKCIRYSWLPQVYALAVKCFGVNGMLDYMEHTLNDMVLMGFRVDSSIGNAYVVYYSMFGSLSEMEVAYERLKKSKILLEEEGIRAVGLAYLRKNKFYALGEFVRDVGLGRRNVGNLLWNLLLVSYAAKFKMKTLQREFLAMVGGGFRPDLTTFNIRALAFCKMNLFWDLHVSLEHMRHENVVPDLVTYGCVVDAYVDKRMGRNLDFALQRMGDLDECPLVRTEPFVFEAMGKGDFHLNSESFMEFNESKIWTYMKLIGVYLKKRHRRNQIFWNY